MSPAEPPEDARTSSKSPLAPATLMRMATAYLARYSASTARLGQVLERKIRRRCDRLNISVPDDVDIRTMIDGVVDRLSRAGLLNDAVYARGRAAALARKGWPAWRIRAELDRAGIAPEDDGFAGTIALDETAQARRLAERRRLGPFRPGDRDVYRDKDIARLARAGFPVSVARAVVDGDR